MEIEVDEKCPLFKNLEKKQKVFFSVSTAWIAWTARINHKDPTVWPADYQRSTLHVDPRAILPGFLSSLHINQ